MVEQPSLRALCELSALFWDTAKVVCGADCAHTKTKVELETVQPQQRGGPQYVMSLLTASSLLPQGILQFPPPQKVFILGLAFFMRFTNKTSKDFCLDGHKATIRAQIKVVSQVSCTA
jgi:hypothetical protein